MEELIPLSKEAFYLFQKLLVEKSGLLFDGNKRQTLYATILERASERGLSSCEEYYDFLVKDPRGNSELMELLDRLTINETYFFRNEQQFETLKNHVIPEIVKRKMYVPGRPLRIWSAGCSRGNEPYSIAAMLLETLPFPENWDISVLGTDVNRKALAIAKEGVYVEADMRRVSNYYINKYFDREGDKYILKDLVKRMVSFEYHNLAKDPFFIDRMQKLDIIFCRNVTIYFDIDTTKRITDNFYNCLDQDGYLFIGHAETLWRINNKFMPVEFPQSIIYKKALHPAKETGEKPFMGVPEINLDDFGFFVPARAKESLTETVQAEAEAYQAAPIVSEEEKTKKKGGIHLDVLYKKAAKLFNEKKYEESLDLIDRILAEDENNVLAHFAKANILSNQAKYELAVEELHKIIKEDNLYVEAYYLLGVLAYKVGNLTEAEEQFRRVIYVDPGIELAYYNLGNIYMCKGEYSGAAREYKNAVKLLEKRPQNDTVKFSENFTVDFLLRACKKNLEHGYNKYGGRDI